LENTQNHSLKQQAKHKDHCRKNKTMG